MAPICPRVPSDLLLLVTGRIRTSHNIRRRVVARSKLFLAGGTERYLEMKPFRSLQVVDHFQKVTGLRVAIRTQHPH